jgi:hypothetical protein
MFGAVLRRRFQKRRVGTQTRNDIAFHRQSVAA